MSKIQTVLAFLSLVVIGVVWGRVIGTSSTTTSTTTTKDRLHLALTSLAGNGRHFEETMTPTTEGSRFMLRDSEDSDGSTGRGSACGFRFISTAMSENITQKCVNLIGFRMENFPPKQEDLIKINYEDKCFSKCYLTELNYMTVSDTFDPNRIIQEIKRETSNNHEKVTNARINASNKCLKYTEDMAIDEGGVPNSPCKFALIFFVCVRDSERRMIC